MLITGTAGSETINGTVDNNWISGNGGTDQMVGGLGSDYYVVDSSGCGKTARMRQIDELIDARLDSRLTVSELADALSLSVGFFSRAFKAAVGKTPHSYLIDRRLSRARALLRRTELDLSDIAYASGFASHAHLTATFRRRLGIAPREFQRSAR